MKKEHSTVEHVERAIYDLEKYMETGTEGGKREKENIRELKFLKDSIQYVGQVQ